MERPAGQPGARLQLVAQVDVACSEGSCEGPSAGNTDYTEISPIWEGKCCWRYMESLSLLPTGDPAPELDLLSLL